MKRFIFSEITFEDIKTCVDLKRTNKTEKIWEDIDNIDLNEEDLQQIQFIQTRLRKTQLHIMNEATIWGRAIYPLLLLIEKRSIEAWAEVSLAAHYKTFTLEGTVDGIIAENIGGYLEAPYFIIVETKRGINAKNPIPQLYAELLAVAMLNQQQSPQDSQRVFGCYTIVDSWTFVQADVFNIDSKCPRLEISTSKEYDEKYEAQSILKILKNILQVMMQK